MKPIKLPGDKSISHRALIFSALANGDSTLENLSPSVDVMSSRSVLKDLGVTIKEKSTKVKVSGSGLFLKRPTKPLDCGNAGTLMRLMMGVLSGQKFYSELTGDESLSRRPMDRVSNPLIQMGAKIDLTENIYSPVKISQSLIVGGDVEVRVASAQVKSALLLAGLYSNKNNLVLSGLLNTRDHTERMLKFYGADIEIMSDSITLYKNSKLEAKNYVIPNDISAASFWLSYSLLANHKIELNNLLLTPSRLGFLNVLERSGAKFKIQLTNEVPEVVGTIILEPSLIKPFKVLESEVPSLIDEIPVMCLLASQLDGDSEILGAGELRVKESDRLTTTQKALDSIGIKIYIKDENIYIPGAQKIIGGVVDSYNDHRIAMMAGIASCFAKKDMKIINKECANISDPYFFKNLENIG